MSDDPRWPAQDPVDPSAPQERGIGGQGFPNYSPIDLRPEMGAPTPYPKAEPLPYPPGIPREKVSDFVLLAQKALQSILKAPYSRELLQSFMEESARTSFRPVHLPPWPEAPIAGVLVGGVSARTTIPAGTTVNLVTATIPPGCFGFFAWLGQDTQNDTAGAGRTDWVGLSWDVTRGPSSTALETIPSYTGITSQLGQIEAPCRVNVFAPAGVCVLRVSNTTGADIPGVRGRLHGWYWPVAVRMSSIHVNEMIKG